MRLRTHILTSTLLAAALYSRAPRRAALLALGGVLLDADHYLVYALRSGDWSPLGALRYDRRRHLPRTAADTRPHYGSLRSPAHRAQLTLPLALAAGLALAGGAPAGDRRHAAPGARLPLPESRLARVAACRRTLRALRPAGPGAHHLLRSPAAPRRRALVARQSRGLVPPVQVCGVRLLEQ
ncbi:MAG TPA: hypothetical protein VF897_07620 [Roseiflexaceae bacterium]